MLMYRIILKLAELSHFLADFGPIQKMYLPLKFEPLNQTGRNFQAQEIPDKW